MSVTQRCVTTVSLRAWVLANDVHPMPRFAVQISFAFALCENSEFMGQLQNAWKETVISRHIKCTIMGHALIGLLHHLSMLKALTKCIICPGTIHTATTCDCKTVPHSSLTRSLMSPTPELCSLSLLIGCQCQQALVHAGKIYAGQLLAGQAAQHHWAGAWPDQRCSAWAPGVGGAHHRPGGHCRLDAPQPPAQL